YFFVFFFQAEDGIRDKLVTGVPCALPISPRPPRPRAPRSRRSSPPVGARGEALSLPSGSGGAGAALGGSSSIRGLKFGSISTTRSEERRVGKECRSRWAAEDDEKRKVSKE